jgi:branched-chain amino acid transport system ATP-binding protein
MPGGERQMLVVGRALMSDPKLLLLHEPSLGLAPTIIETMYETFLRLHKGGSPCCWPSGRWTLPWEVADRAYVLQVGRSVLSGEASELANAPKIQRIYLGIA